MDRTCGHFFVDYGNMKFNNFVQLVDLIIISNFNLISHVLYMQPYFYIFLVLFSSCLVYGLAIMIRLMENRHI